MGERRLDIGPDDPVPLSQAAALFFPAGGITLQSLRTEIRKGNLIAERIAGRYFVTRQAIEEMRERCRIQPKAQGSTSENGEAVRQPGSYGTPGQKSQLDAAKATASRLKGRSPTTSAGNTEDQPGRVIPIR